MTPEEHKQRHIELHKSLDELVADFIFKANLLPSKSTVFELMEWSYKQTDNPDHDPRFNDFIDTEEAKSNQ